MAIKIAIADDYKLFREGGKRILEMEEDLEAAAEGEDGRDALIIDKNYKLTLDYGYSICLLWMASKQRISWMNTVISLSFYDDENYVTRVPG